MSLYGGITVSGVAPHAGAWIETPFKSTDTLRAPQVAPHAGAWIETCERRREWWWSDPVAPHAGAWIETLKDKVVGGRVDSRAPRGRVD